MENPPVTVSTLDVMREHLSTTLEASKANRVSNPALAQKLGRDAVSLTAIIARLERSQPDPPLVPRTDIEAAQQEILRRLDELIKRPAVCSVCQKKSGK